MYWSSFPTMESTVDDHLTTDTDFSTDVPLILKKVRKGSYGPSLMMQGLYYFIGSLGLIGNLFVIFIILHTSSMRKVVTTTFILNQSLVDALAGFFLILVHLFDDRDRYFDTLADELYCRIWLSRSLLWVMFMTSSLNLMAITLERLTAVWKPLWHKISFTRTKQMVVIGVIWTFGPAIRLMHGFADSRIRKSGRCSPIGAPGLFGEVSGFIQIIFEYGLPVTVFIVSYTKIAWTLRAQRKIMHSSVVTSSSHQAPVHGGKNIIKTMLLVCCCFLVCWSINEVYYLLYLTGHKIDFSHPFYDFSVIAVFCNCCCNPFVYIFKFKDFQQGVRDFFKCGKRSTVAPHSANSSETGTINNSMI